MPNVCGPSWQRPATARQPSAGLAGRAERPRGGGPSLACYRPDKRPDRGDPGHLATNRRASRPAHIRPNRRIDQGRRSSLRHAARPPRSLTTRPDTFSTMAARDQSSHAGSVGFAAAIGGVAGACLAASRGPRVAGLGAIVGAVALATSERIARAQQQPGEIPPLWARIATSAALVAPVGWVGRADLRRTARRRHRHRFARRCAGGPSAEGRLRTVTRCGRRRCFRRTRRPVPAAVVASTTMLATGALGTGVPGRQVSLLAERVPPRTCPSSSRARPDAVCRHRLRPGPGGRDRRQLHRRRTGRGIVASLDELAGPGFDPAASIRWCASSTSTPPGSRSTSSRSGGSGCGPATCCTAHLVARPLGQANVPMNQRETAARHPQPDRHDHPARRAGGRGPGVDPLVRRHRRAHLRRHLHHVPARGPRVRQRRFPGSARQLHGHPAAAARPGGGLMLTSRSELEHPGHYLAYIDPDSRTHRAGRARLRRAARRLCRRR